MKAKTFALSAIGALMITSTAMAEAEPLKYGIMASDQDLSSGTATATKVYTKANGWIVAHRTEDGMKPGEVIGQTEITPGQNQNVVINLDEDIEDGEKILLMLHKEDGSNVGFNYKSGGDEDGPVMKDGKMVTKVITAE